MKRTSKYMSVALGCLLMAATVKPARAANVSARPIKFGTILPSTCWAGDVFFNTTAPAGANLFACVATNTWVVQALTSVGGDVTGSPDATKVTQIQGRPVASTAPQSGQLLMWNGATSRWEPQAVGAVNMGGDVTGASIVATVAKIQNRAVASTAPQAGQVLTWSASSSRWEPQAPSGGTVTLAGDVTGAAGSNVVTQIQGKAVASTAPSAGQSLVWNGTSARWEPQGPASLAGDVTGAAGSNVVTQIQGKAVASTAPQASQVLTWNASSSRWEPQAPSGGTVTLAGDVTGAAGSNVVTQIQGKAVASTAPSAGQALVWNASSSRWEPQTISAAEDGGNYMASKMGDLQVTRTSANTLTIGENCSITAACNVRFGSFLYSITAPMTVTLSSGSGNALFYVTSSGTVTVGHSMSVSCTGTCQAIPGVTAFTDDVIPLYTWHATSGAWDSAGSDQRAFLGTKNVLAGAGLQSSDESGNARIVVDQTLIGLRTGVPATASSNCTAGAWASDTSYYYVCVSQNAWRRAALTSW